MTEAQLQAAVIECAGWLGWRCYHTFDSRHSAAGFPDLVLCKPPRLLFVELKRDGREPTEAQLEWLSLLKDCGPRSFVWTPRLWSDGTVERILRGDGA